MARTLAIVSLLLLPLVGCSETYRGQTQGYAAGLRSPRGLRAIRSPMDAAPGGVNSGTGLRTAQTPPANTMMGVYDANTESGGAHLGSTAVTWESSSRTLTIMPGSATPENSPIGGGYTRPPWVSPDVYYNPVTRTWSFQ
jgi:hypothetical protein